MKIIHPAIEGLVLIDPDVYHDGRGYFMEAWNAYSYAKAGIPLNFVQDNVSSSTMGTLRGLHFQNPNPQGKLVSVLQGEVYDVAVDLRRSSPTFKKAFSTVLSSDNKRQMYIPTGFAHGFLVMSVTAIFHYKCTGYYYPQDEVGLQWDDPDLAILWPGGHPVLSPKDAHASLLKDIPLDRLFG